MQNKGSTRMCAFAIVSTSSILSMSVNDDAGTLFAF
jgi:hypothetical protein